MNDLSTALRELAGEVTAPHAADPGDLWSRGRSRVRRQRVAAVVTMLVLGALGYVGIVRPTPTVVMPAGAPHAAAIPENIWAPNRFLAGVSKLGPPGVLAAIAATADHDDQHYFGRWFGIGATTGRYVALDLPGRASDSAMWLSPDGARIAYVITGPTRKKDYGPTTNNSDGGPFPPAPPTGLGVYDTRTGSVVRFRTLTDRGWSAGNDLRLAWLGASTVVFTYSTAVTMNQMMGAGTWIWHPGVDAPARAPTASQDPYDTTYVPAQPANTFVRSIVDGTTSTFDVVDDEGRPTGKRISAPLSAGACPCAASVSGSRVVFAGGAPMPDGGTIQRVQVGRSPGSTHTHDFTPIGTSIFQQFLGWRSPTAVLFAGVRGQSHGGELGFADGSNNDGFYVDDLAGLTEVRVGTLVGIDPTTITVANTILTEPMTHGRKPPSIWAAREIQLAVALAVVVLVGAIAWLWRRRKPWRHYVTTEWQRSDRLRP